MFLAGSVPLENDKSSPRNIPATPSFGQTSLKFLTIDNYKLIHENTQPGRKQREGGLPAGIFDFCRDFRSS